MTGYNYFKPFRPFLNGGTLKQISKKTAKGLIKRKGLKIEADKYGDREQGVRRFVSGAGEVVIAFCE